MGGSGEVWKKCVIFFASFLSVLCSLVVGEDRGNGFEYLCFHSTIAFQETLSEKGGLSLR